MSALGKEARRVKQNNLEDMSDRLDTYLIEKERFAASQTMIFLLRYFTEKEKKGEAVPQSDVCRVEIWLAGTLLHSSVQRWSAISSNITVAEYEAATTYGHYALQEVPVICSFPTNKGNHWTICLNMLQTSRQPFKSAFQKSRRRPGMLPPLLTRTYIRTCTWTVCTKLVCGLVAVLESCFFQLRACHFAISTTHVHVHVYTCPIIVHIYNVHVHHTYRYLALLWLVAWFVQEIWTQPAELPQ